MAFVWGTIAVMGAAFLLELVWGPGRRRREYLLLAFTDRIDLPVTVPAIGLVDRRIRDRSMGLAAGGLVAALAFALVALVWPEFVPIGVAGFATTGLIVAAMAAGGGITAARQFAAPQGADAPRIARLDAPTLDDYVHPGWAWTAAIGAAAATILTAGVLTGAARGYATEAGLPLAGLAVLATLSLGGVVGAVFLTRRLLAIPQLASDERELQWDDALRAYALRDIWIASIGLSAATVVSASSWIFSASSPAFFAGILIGVAPLVLLGFRASNRSSRRLWRSSAAVS